MGFGGVDVDELDISVSCRLRSVGSVACNEDWRSGTAGTGAAFQEPSKYIFMAEKGKLRSLHQCNNLTSLYVIAALDLELLQDIIRDFANYSLQQPGKFIVLIFELA